MPTKKATSQSEVQPVKKHRLVDDYSEIMRREPVSDGCFLSYAPKPKNISIDIQAQNEHIILLLRQHPITQLRWIFTLLVLLALPMLFSFSGVFSFMPPAYQFGGLLGWSLLTFGFGIESFLKWFYRVYIITDERIIDVDFISMIHKDVSTAKVDKIEDITSLSGGFLASIFDFGTVIIQTAATKQEFGFKNVPHPARVAALLNELILEEEREKHEGRIQ